MAEVPRTQWIRADPADAPGDQEVPGQAFLTALLDHFTTGVSKFAPLARVPVSALRVEQTSETPSEEPVGPIVVLDSSFNPPTLAHLHMIRQGLVTAAHPTRLVLLLSTQNADKSSAERDDLILRIQMMWILARMIASRASEEVPLRAVLEGTAPASRTDILPDSLRDIEVALTKVPYFHDKAAAMTEWMQTSKLASSGRPAEPKAAVASMTQGQTWLLGFDTLIRLFDTKYYEPSNSLAVLGPFFLSHVVYVVPRPQGSSRSGEIPDESTQVSKFMDGMRSADRPVPGWQASWFNKVVVLDAKGGEPISSTLARQTAAEARFGDLHLLLPRSIVDWVIGQRMYCERRV